MAMGTSVPARAVAPAMTVPSPPQTKTTAQPSSTACLHMPTPGSSSVVSSQSGGSQPARDMKVSARCLSAAGSVTFVGLTTNAARLTGPPRSPARGLVKGPPVHPTLDG